MLLIFTGSPAFSKVDRAPIEGIHQRQRASTTAQDYAGSGGFILGAVRASVQGGKFSKMDSKISILGGFFCCPGVTFLQFKFGSVSWLVVSVK